MHGIRWLLWMGGWLWLIACWGDSPGLAQQSPRKIVLIAGTLDAGHPRGTHEYQKAVRRLERELAPLGQRLNFQVETHLDGWPQDPQTLEEASTILLVSSGSDRQRDAHPFLADDRQAILQRQMDRGCGMVLIHWSTFWPEDRRESVLRWVGGYFDYQTGPPPRRWYSHIRTMESDCAVVAADHPVANGVRRFPLREEFYYHLQFAPPEYGKRIPLLQTRVPEFEDPQTIAWAFERTGGGRGLAFTGGHFDANWNQPDLRKLIANGILWTAGIAVPPRGVISRPQPLPAGQVDVLDPERINTLLITGDQHPAHDWRTTSAVLTEALSRDPRIAVDQRTIEFLEDPRLQDYDTIVFNYCNWNQPGLSPRAKENFLRFLQRGGGLNLIHFANGAFHHSLPQSPDSDWPEFRKICRRVWDHSGQSGHDRYGPFAVQVQLPDHPVARGVGDFQTVDELYFRQAGELPVEVVATARSAVTGEDEPMAFVHVYEKARVFQTVLGHSAESLRVPGTSRLIQNAVAWTAHRPVLEDRPSGKALVPGKNGNQVLDARQGLVRIEPRPAEATLVGRSVSCRARLAGAEQFNILVAQHPKTSRRHWELYSYQKSGVLSLYLPGYQPAEIKSDTDICDGKWHELQADFDGQTVVLKVDGTEVKRQQVTPAGVSEDATGPLTIGALASQQIGCQGWLDDVRLSTLEQPGSGNLGFWDFEQADEQAIEDRSPLGQPTEFIRTQLGADYLAKWTPKSRQNIRFPYENETDEDWVDDRFSRMDTGPLFAYSIQVPGRGMVPKAIAVRGARDQQDSWLLDSESLRVEAAWSGEFLALPPARFGILNMPSVAGSIDFRSDPDAGWKHEIEGKLQAFDRAKKRLLAYRPTSQGLWIEYELGGQRIEETIQSQWKQGTRVFQRLMRRIGDRPPTPLTLDLGSSDQGWTWQSGTDPAQSLAAGQRLQIPWPVGTQELRLSYAAVDDLARGSALLQSLPVIRWEPLPSWGDTATPQVTRGVRGEESGPFAVDTLTLPYENPDQALMFVGGFDFLPDGRAVVCTVHGDVWLVDGIDEDLDELRWYRYATGLYQPLGLKVVDQSAYVMCRDRIIQLELDRPTRELAAPVYRSFNEDLVVTGQGHAYAMSLETDPEGNFYFIKSGGTPPHGGTMLRVAADGSAMEVFATGYRHANGLGISPQGLITSADNEGNWMPSTRIDVVTRGGFYGHMPTHRRAVPPTTYDPPLLWLPRELDNSAGGQVWVDSPRWGPLQGRMVHLSYGRCTAIVVLPQQLQGDLWQAAAYRLEITPFLSGAMRGRFREQDGHLYVGGLDGWQTAAVRDGCLQRVRATGKPFLHPVGFQVAGNQIHIDFPQPLDPATIGPDAWSVQQWNYRYSQDYGSDHYRVSQPDQVGHDEVPVDRAELSSDGKRVTLSFGRLQPVMQMNLQATLKTAQGQKLDVNLFNTIHGAVGD